MFDLGFVDAPNRCRKTEIDYAVRHCKTVVLHDADARYVLPYRLKYGGYRLCESLWVIE